MHYNICVYASFTDNNVITSVSNIAHIKSNKNRVVSY